VALEAVGDWCRSAKEKTAAGTATAKVINANVPPLHLVSHQLLVNDDLTRRGRLMKKSRRNGVARRPSMIRQTPKSRPPRG
jgi:hypothetical protein